MTENSFVRLAVYDSESEAILAKAVLEENSIHTTVSGLEPTTLGIALDGEDSIQLFVLEEDLERAKVLIQNIAGEEDPIPPWTCQCGEEVDEGFFVCWSCGKEYQPPG